MTGDRERAGEMAHWAGAFVAQATQGPAPRGNAKHGCTVTMVISGRDTGGLPGLAWCQTCSAFTERPNLKSISWIIKKDAQGPPVLSAHSPMYLSPI